ncbi:venom serine protease-like [Eupeodes corollae]|uniref:venom serine protease-like n=1 Tax=Eupeodes corollae TaxID=290404 RepID=UPI00248FE3A5|nr:venom serine protease-like [Eupeodes corollae]
MGSVMVLPVFILASCLKCFLTYELFHSCDHFLKLNANQKIFINSPYYPNSYPQGTSCRYTVEAPTDFELKFRCEIDFITDNEMKCNSDVFYFNNKGSELIYGSEYFCGLGSLERKSFNNKGTISYISSSAFNRTLNKKSNDKSSKSGRFSCLVEAIEAPCDCGWSSTQRVTGGSEATLGEFPSMAAVIQKLGNKIFCGATIIHHRFLLSAAHCFIPQEVSHPKLITIVVGADDLSSIHDSFYSQQRYDIEDIQNHGNFRLRNLINDIALLKTVRSIEWSQVVGPACLPFRFDKESLGGLEVDTAGWGTTSFGGQQSRKLLKTNLFILKNEECKQSVHAVMGSQLCTSSSPGKDTCQYDSGGGLFLRMNRMYAVAVVSYGYACDGEVPSVNSRISTYLKWVQAMTRNVKFCVK